MEATEKTAVTDAGEDLILPEDWHEGYDIFSEEEEAPQEPAGEAEEAAEERGDTPPEEGKAPEKGPERAGRVLKLKINHAEEDFDVDAATDEELAAQIQKARAYDRLVESRAAQTYRDTYREQREAGMSEIVARLAAREAAGGKDYDLEEPQGDAPRDTMADVRKLMESYPDAKEMPKEVMDAYQSGQDLTAAYGAYQARRQSEELQSLREEVARLKQQQDAASRAPVKGTTDGGTEKQGKIDPFLEGFDAPW